MNAEKASTENHVEDDSQSSKDIKRRSVYPTKDLNTIIDFVSKIYSTLGHTEHHSNKAIATVHGLVSDSIKMHLSTAQQYRLLEIKHGVGYKITDLFQRVFLPKSPAEKRSAIIESLKSPETYQQLFKDYEYHLVPADGVKNHFIRTFGFKEDAATRAAQIFIDNLKEFDLLDNRGILTSALPPKPPVSEAIEVNSNDNNSDGSNNDRNDSQPPAVHRPEKIIFQSEIDREGKKTIPIYLIDGKQAMFVYPDNITEDDIELVRHQVDGILLRIKLETKAKSKPTNE